MIFIGKTHGFSNVSFPYGNQAFLGNPPGKIHQNLMILSANLDKNACNVGGRDTAWFWGRSRDRYCWMSSDGHLAIWEWSAQRTLKDSMVCDSCAFDCEIGKIQRSTTTVFWALKMGNIWSNGYQIIGENDDQRWNLAASAGHFLTRPGGKFWRLLRCAADVTRTVGPPKGPTPTPQPLGQPTPHQPALRVLFLPWGTTLEFSVSQVLTSTAPTTWFLDSNFYWQAVQDFFLHCSFKLNLFWL